MNLKQLHNVLIDSLWYSLPPVWQVNLITTTVPCNAQPAVWCSIKRPHLEHLPSFWYLNINLGRMSSLFLYNKSILHRIKSMFSKPYWTWETRSTFFSAMLSDPEEGGMKYGQNLRNQVSFHKYASCSSNQEIKHVQLTGLDSDGSRKEIIGYKLNIYFKKEWFVKFLNHLKWFMSQNKNNIDNKFIVIFISWEVLSKESYLTGRS